MRWDRFFSVAVVQPFKEGLGSETAWLPILMYHSISDDSETGVSPYYRTATSPEIFRQHMQLLKTSGYKGVDIKTGIASLKNALQDKLAVITFDDGYRDFYTNAYPALSEHAFTATMFLPTAFIGETHREFKSRECMTWSEVKELQQAGIYFGSHTATHPRLVELDWPQIKTELRNSKAEIENHLGVPADTFAYPFAFPETNKPFVRRLSETLLETGYQCCATTRIGRVKAGDDLMQLKRLPANSCDDSKLFQAKLDGAYDWLAPVQTGVKRIKSAMAPPRPTAACNCHSHAAKPVTATKSSAPETQKH
jgi:peptidoglycan/xylan/chitin deacetylase (PgdA/CDA1 family)